MFAQIFLGLFVLVRAAFDFLFIWFRSSDPLSQRIREKKNVHQYRALHGLLHIAAAILFVSMAFIERHGILQPVWFILIYIFVGAAIVAAMLMLNFKYLGNWR